MNKRRVGVIGGSGIYNLPNLDCKKWVKVGTRFGDPSDEILEATFGLMRQLSIENGKYNIAVNGINADKIKSGLLNKDMILKRSKARKISEKAYMENNLLGATVEAKHVADAFLVLANLEKTTGHVITLDGGNVEASLR